MLRNITKIGTKTAQNQGGGSQKLPKIQKFLLHFFLNLGPLENTREQMPRNITNMRTKTAENQGGSEGRGGGEGGVQIHT